MVVAFDNDDHDARLSLRQTEILAKLQTIVDDIADCGCDQYVVLPIALNASRLNCSAQKVGPDLSSGIWTVHARVDPRVAIYG